MLPIRETRHFWKKRSQDCYPIPRWKIMSQVDI